MTKSKLRLQYFWECPAQGLNEIHILKWSAHTLLLYKCVWCVRKVMRIISHMSRHIQWRYSLPICTFLVEELPWVPPSQGQMFRDGAEEFNDMGEVVLISRIALTRVRLEQVIASRQLECLPGENLVLKANTLYTEISYTGNINYLLNR